MRTLNSGCLGTLRQTGCTYNCQCESENHYMSHIHDPLLRNYSGWVHAPCHTDSQLPYVNPPSRKTTRQQLKERQGDNLGDRVPRSRCPVQAGYGDVAGTAIECTSVRWQARGAAFPASVVGILTPCLDSRTLIYHVFTNRQPYSYRCTSVHTQIAFRTVIPWPNTGKG